MPQTIKYTGTQVRWSELPVTGKQSTWNPGHQEERSDAEAALLKGTGLFTDVVALSDLNPAALQSLVSGAVNLPGRPRALLFGNSIAYQNTRVMAAGLGTSVSVPYNSGTLAPAGSTALTVAANTLAASGKCAVQLHDGTFHLTTYTGGGTTTITLGTPLPRYVSNSQGTVTTYAGDWPDNISLQIGMLTGALAQLGNPIELISVQGDSGNSARQMLFSLRWYIERYRPDYVIFIGFCENDIPAGVSAESIIAMHKSAAATCLTLRTRPIFFSPLPSNSYTAGAQATVFDTVKTFVLNTLPTLFPNVSIPAIDASSPWLDLTAPTLRKPLTSVSTDGIHPDRAKRWTAANYFVSALQAIFGTRSSLADLAWNTNPTLTGSGGAVVNVTNSGVADGWTARQANHGATPVASKNSDGSQKIAVASFVAGGTAPTLWVVQTVPPVFNNADLAKYAAIKVFVKLRVNSATGLDWFGPQLRYNDTTEQGSAGNSSSGAGNYVGSDAGLVGKIVTLETFAVPAQLRAAGTDYYDIRFFLKCQPSVSVAYDIDIFEIGWTQASPDEVFYA